MIQTTKLRACLLVLLWLGFFTMPANAAVTQAQIDEVGKDLSCLCGGCPHRPLDECTCGHAQQERDRIKSLLAAGKSKRAIIDAFVADFGKQVLSKPPAEGFNLTAWVMPPLVLLIGFFVVRSVLRHWSQSQPATASSSPSAGENAPYLSRLEQELRERDL